MRNKEIKERINNAISNSVPDVLDNILVKCEKERGFSKKMKTKETISNGGIRRFWNLKIGLGLCVILLGVFGLIQYNRLYGVYSVIEFDVNPSIELKINQKEDIIEANALNDDAKKVLDDMDLDGVDLNVAVNAIIGSMLKNGYLTIDQNSILVSVKNGDEEKRKELQKEISDEINSLLKASSINGSILTQEYDNNDKDIEKLSDDYNISVGKAKLISNVLEAKITNSKGELYTFNTLAGLSITELNLLLNEKKSDVSNVNSTGTASTTAYIGRDKALEIALKNANLKESNVKEIEVEFDADDGVLIYEVEFKLNGKEYEYDIDAKTGDIIYKEIDVDDDYYENNSSSSSNTSNNSSSNYIGNSKAKSIALNDASVSSNDIRELEIELDREDGIYVYEVEFKVGNKEYKYEINATTGKILDKEIEIDD